MLSRSARGPNRPKGPSDGPRAATDEAGRGGRRGGAGLNYSCVRRLIPPGSSPYPSCIHPLLFPPLLHPPPPPCAAFATRAACPESAPARWGTQPACRSRMRRSPRCALHGARRRRRLNQINGCENECANTKLYPSKKKRLVTSSPGAVDAGCRIPAIPLA